MLLADVGVPMIVVQWPLMFAALLPVIALEAWIFRRQLKLPPGRVVKGAAVANLVSTIVGVPIAWAVMLALEFGVMGTVVRYAEQRHWSTTSPLWSVLSFFMSAWVGPPISSYAGIALAATVLLIPTYFLSVWIERLVCRRSFNPIEPKAVDRAVRLANLCSYGFLFILALGWYGYQLAWGTDTAPPLRRVSQSPLVDLRYLHEVAIPAHDSKGDGKQFRAAVSRLEADLSEFDGVMRDVETGKVPVSLRRDRGVWESTFENDRHWIWVDYTSKTGPARAFQIHENNNGPNQQPDYCIAEFGPAGFLSEADTPDHDFRFDAAGRFRN